MNPLFFILAAVVIVAVFLVLIFNRRGQEKLDIEAARRIRDMQSELDVGQQTLMGLRYRSQIQEIITRLSSHFIQMPEQDLDAGIETALGELGEFSEVDRAYLFLFSESDDTFSNTHEWVAPGTSAEKANLQNLPTSISPWWIKK